MLRRRDGIELWTVEHFHVEVARVFRRDTLRGVISDDDASTLVTALATWPLDVVSIAPLLEEACSSGTTSRYVRTRSTGPRSSGKWPRTEVQSAERIVTGEDSRTRSVAAPERRGPVPGR